MTFQIEENYHLEANHITKFNRMLFELNHTYGVYFAKKNVDSYIFLTRKNSHVILCFCCDVIYDNM